MKRVVYKGVVLMKGSHALSLWEAWQKATSDRNKAQRALDDHMRAVDQAATDLLTRYPSA